MSFNVINQVAVGVRQPTAASGLNTHEANPINPSVPMSKESPPETAGSVGSDPARCS